ncbi:helix-turn-helix transcriptional regulator [Micromonospora sp. MH33]|uniref:helix-turn-helix transcriptional regulator n=1 Tax=Micromonospora sp. MH33 TaxID=1945509 RepID=UPI00143D5696|nr:helix-turn-helix transcriptional regulator [Micromonospora sp. MH33]
MSRDLVSPVVVGRRRELGRLRALLDQVITGTPAVALIAGEAGVGKSRLTQELAAGAAGRGVRVLSGGCVELGGEGIPLAPLVDVLRALARSTPADELDRLLGPARREFARLLPELDPAGTVGARQDGSAAQLFEHVLGLITRLAAQRPLLLVVEDLHWADRSTRDLVAFLVQTLRELGVLLLLTYRSDELHRRHPLRPLVTGWERVRSVERIEVGRFSREEVAAQLQAIRRTAPGAHFAAVVFERSQGNAFLVEEILAAVDGGADPGDLPPSLRDVLLARTERVSEAAQRVLRAAAAASPRVEDRLLEVVVGMPEAQLYPALRETVEHHLLVVDHSGRGYAFRHELTRDAVYEDMLPGERVRLHAAYGAALESDPTLLGDDTGVAATLAHHWYAALDLPRALSASVQAGRQAAAGYASAEALHHLERALQLWTRVSDAAERAGVDWVGLNVLAAEAAWAAGEINRGLSIVDQVLADPESVTDPVRQAHVVERRAYMLRALGRDEEAGGQLREALALLPAQPLTTTHAAVLASLANSLMRIDELEQGVEVARSAVEAAAAVGATAQQADALITLGHTCGYLGDAPSGLTALHDGLALAEREGLSGVALRGYINLSDLLEMLGRHAEAADAARAGVELAARLGHTRSLGAMLVGNLAESLMRLGRWREALDLVTESLADDPSGVFASTLLLQRGELQGWQGAAQAAESDLREARHQFGGGTDAQFTAPMTFIEAELARAAGDLAAARQHVRAALDRPIVGQGVRYAWPLIWLGMRIEADAAAGEPSNTDIRQRHDALQALAVAIPRNATPAQAYYALTTAEAARLNGSGEVAAWQAAVTACRAADEAFPLCYSLFRLAEAQCGTTPSDTSAAGATAQECLRLADDLAATTSHDVRALARRARLRLEQSSSATTGESQSQRQIGFRLTDREREVLALVAEGCSNGQIATALFISPKTASVHVSNILAKLDAASRTEAAVLAHRLGLLTT